MTPKEVTLAEAAKLMGMSRWGTRKRLATLGVLRRVRRDQRWLYVVSLSDIHRNLIPFDDCPVMVKEVAELQEIVEALKAGQIRLAERIGALERRSS